MGNNKKIEIHDTTLRDGAQGEGVSFTVAGKLKVAKILDELGASFIEGGMPGSSAAELEFFRQVKKLKLRSEVVAFGSTVHPKNIHAPGRDKSMRALLKADTKWVTVFGKSWLLHLGEAGLKITPEDNLKLIRNTVKYLVLKGKNVIYDAEHFFQGYQDDSVYALETLGAAAEGGACRLVLCDTNGGTLPDDIKEITREVAESFNIPIGIHCHNDSGLAVANTMAAVFGGAVHIQGTINGLGERCGNADLITVVANLQIKKGYDCLPDDSLARFTEVSKFVSEISNVPHRNSLPYVGQSAFAHKGGIHVSAVQKDPKTYEHIDPSLVGNERRIIISKQAGKGAIRAKINLMFPRLNGKDEDIEKIVKKVKAMEQKGYCFESAEASFCLLVLKTLGAYKPMIHVDRFKTSVEGSVSNGKTGKVITEATVMIRGTGGQGEHTAALGNGPVNALDQALRKAMEKEEFYPGWKQVSLNDYQVHIIDNKEGTAAKVTVFIGFTDGRESWTTIGVSENLIEASMEALVAGFEYFLLVHSRNREKK